MAMQQIANLGFTLSQKTAKRLTRNVVERYAQAIQGLSRELKEDVLALGHNGIKLKLKSKGWFTSKDYVSIRYTDVRTGQTHKVKITSRDKAQAVGDYIKDAIAQAKTIQKLMINHQQDASIIHAKPIRREQFVNCLEGVGDNGVIEHARELVQHNFPPNMAGNNHVRYTFKRQRAVWWNPWTWNHKKSFEVTVPQRGEVYSEVKPKHQSVDHEFFSSPQTGAAAKVVNCFERRINADAPPQYTYRQVRQAADKLEQIPQHLDTLYQEPMDRLNHDAFNAFLDRNAAHVGNETRLNAGFDAWVQPTTDALQGAKSRLRAIDADMEANIAALQTRAYHTPSYAVLHRADRERVIQNADAQRGEGTCLSDALPHQFDVAVAERRRDFTAARQAATDARTAGRDPVRAFRQSHRQEERRALTEDGGGIEQRQREVDAANAAVQRVEQDIVDAPWERGDLQRRLQQAEVRREQTVQRLDNWRGQPDIAAFEQLEQPVWRRLSEALQPKFDAAQEAAAYLPAGQGQEELLAAQQAVADLLANPAADRTALQAYLANKNLARRLAPPAGGAELPALQNVRLAEQAALEQFEQHIPGLQGPAHQGFLNALKQGVLDGQDVVASLPVDQFAAFRAAQNAAAELVNNPATQAERFAFLQDRARLAPRQQYIGELRTRFDDVSARIERLSDRYCAAEDAADVANHRLQAVRERADLLADELGLA